MPEFPFIKKQTLAHVFACEFCEISKNTFFTEQLRATISGLLEGQDLLQIREDNTNQGKHYHTSQLSYKSKYLLGKILQILPNYIILQIKLFILAT